MILNKLQNTEKKENKFFKNRDKLEIILDNVSFSYNSDKVT